MVSNIFRCRKREIAHEDPVGKDYFTVPCVVDLYSSQAAFAASYAAAVHQLQQRHSVMPPHNPPPHHLMAHLASAAAVMMGRGIHQSIPPSARNALPSHYNPSALRQLPPISHVTHGPPLSSSSSSLSRSRSPSDHRSNVEPNLCDLSEPKKKRRFDAILQYLLVTVLVTAGTHSLRHWFQYIRRGAVSPFLREIIVWASQVCSRPLRKSFPVQSKCVHWSSLKMTTYRDYSVLCNLTVGRSRVFSPLLCLQFAGSFGSSFINAIF